MKNNYIRKIAAAMFVALVMPFSAQAQTDDGTMLKIRTTDDCEVSVPLDNVRKLTFGDDSFTLFTVSEGENYGFKYDEVMKIMFEDVATGIDEQIASEADGINIAYDGTFLRITGCKKASQLIVYDISGRPVISQRIQGNAVLSTENLGAGVYILKVNNKTFKFSKL